jgi:uncharacterized protein YkwD
LARPTVPRVNSLPPVEALSPFDPELIRKMHVLHNNARIENRRQLIELNDELCQVAQSYAELLQMYARSAHNLDGWVDHRLTRAGYRFVKCSENLATAGPLVDHEMVFRKWMRSPRHQKNVLGPYREMGIGHSGMMWVVVYASPQR